jgi:lipoprotein signal peptidase
MAHLGYPAYFLTVFGIWKVLGAITIVIPNFKRLKEWAYAGMIFDLTGAAFSRISAHDGIIMAIIPLLVSGVVITSWYLRPDSRRL